MGRRLSVVAAALCALLVVATGCGGSSAGDPVSPDAVPIALREAGLNVTLERAVGSNDPDLRRVSGHPMWIFAGRFGSPSEGSVTIVEMASAAEAKGLVSKIRPERRSSSSFGIDEAWYRNLAIGVVVMPAGSERAELGRIIRALRDIAPA
jgi:hypothetical protein